jgi:hypothetical protein
VQLPNLVRIRAEGRTQVESRIEVTLSAFRSLVGSRYHYLALSVLGSVIYAFRLKKLDKCFCGEYCQPISFCPRLDKGNIDRVDQPEKMSSPSVERTDSHFTIGKLRIRKQQAISRRK